LQYSHQIKLYRNVQDDWNTFRSMVHSVLDNIAKQTYKYKATYLG
jgi:hypothetical protein